MRIVVDELPKAPELCPFTQNIWNEATGRWWDKCKITGEECNIYGATSHCNGLIKSIFAPKPFF